MSENDSSAQRRAPGSFSPRAVGLMLAAVLVVIIVLSSFYVVDARERGIVLRFGRYVGRPSPPGLHLKLPFGIDRVFNVQTEVPHKLEFGFRTEEAGVRSVFSTQDFPEESVMLTGDLNIVDLEWSIQYRILEPNKWLFNIVDGQRTIRDISQSVFNRLVGDRAILDVMGDERPVIQLQAQEQMNALFGVGGYDIGVRVDAVQLQSVVPPRGAVQNAFEDVNKAIQDRNRLINEGKEAYNQAIPRARGDADRLIAEAQGYSAERLNRASGDVARYLQLYEEYEKSPEVTRTRLYYEMFEEVFKDDEGTDLIDKNLTNFIPLKQLGQELSLGGNQ
jgi:membrane protease subunit HflK